MFQIRNTGLWFKAQIVFEEFWLLQASIDIYEFTADGPTDFNSLLCFDLLDDQTFPDTRWLLYTHKKDTYHSRGFQDFRSYVLRNEDKDQIYIWKLSLSHCNYVLWCDDNTHLYTLILTPVLFYGWGQPMVFEG